MGRTRGGGNGRISSSFLVVLLFVALVSQAADMATAQRDSPSDRGPSYFNPSTAVIIVVLVTAFFFLGFFSIYLRRCAGSPLGPGPAGVGGDLLALGAGSGITFAAGAAAVRPRTPRGLDPAALRALPTMAYADVKAHRVGKGELECAVCLSEFDDRDALRLLPRCSHAFHVDCIDAWLASHVTCPVCRANLVFPEAPAPAPAPTVVQPQDVLPAAAPAAPEAVPTAPPEPVTTVTIAVDAEETEEERVKREEAAELVRIGRVKRALRSKSGRPPSPAQFPFPRSHTTGHSLAVAGGVAEERYTLRLPEHVLREAVAAGELRRTKSLQAFRDGTSGRSARRGFGFGFGGAAPRAGRSVRLGQSGRWPNMSALLARTFSSARMPAPWGASARRGEQADDAPGKVVESNAAAGQQCDGGAGAACPLPLGGGRV